MALVGLASASAACASKPAELPAGWISLEGEQRFEIGDDLGWADPELDDSAWRRIRVPGGWISQGLHVAGDIGWYRVRLDLRRVAESRELAVCLGVVGDAAEAYLNGALIGREGRLGLAFVEAPRLLRCRDLPAELLRRDGTDLLALRVQRTYGTGGIEQGPFGLGEAAGARALAAESSRMTVARDAALVSWLVLFFVLALALVGAGRGREHLYFLCFVASLLLYYVPGSVFVYEAGLKTPAAQVALLLGAVAATMLVAPMLNAFFDLRWRRLLLLVWVPGCAVLVGTALLWTSYTVYVTSLWVYAVLLLTSGVCGTTMLLQAVHRRRQEAPVVLAGILLGFGCTAAGVLARGPTAGALVAAGLQVGDLAAPVFLACFLWALGRRFVRQQRRMRHLAVRVVDAHEAERKRIARDLHDGVAQSLAAAKLGLQLASSKAGPDRDISPDDVESALEQLDASIDELHDVAVGLRADVVAELELSEALQWYVGKTASAHGIRATVRSAGPVDAPLELRTHVFRVLQEAVANAIKHGRASELSVRVAADGRQLELVIRDNGAGFDTSNPSSHGGGIGLPSMKERAELLGGSLEVRSAPGRGCEVHLVAPLRFPPVTVAR